MLGSGLGACQEGRGLEICRSAPALGTVRPVLLTLSANALRPHLQQRRGERPPLTLLDMQTRKDLFVPILILGITLASNLAAGFLSGIAVAYTLKWKRLSI